MLFLLDWPQFVPQVLHYGTIPSHSHADITCIHMHYHGNTEECDEPQGLAPK